MSTPTMEALDEPEDEQPAVDAEREAVRALDPQAVYEVMVARLLGSRGPLYDYIAACCRDGDTGPSVRWVSIPDQKAITDELMGLWWEAMDDLAGMTAAGRVP